MPTSKQLHLRMKRRMTGVISRKSYMRWLTLHCFACAEDREVLLDLNSELPTAATAQASSALRQRPSLHISVHSTTRVKCLSFIESTVCRDSKPSFIIRKCHHHDYKLNFVHIFISNSLEPSESGNISPTKRIRQNFRAIRIRIRQGPSSHQNRLNMPKLISECVNSF